MKNCEIKKILEGFAGNIEVNIGLKLDGGVLGSVEIVDFTYNVATKTLSIVGELETEEIPEEEATEEEEENVEE